MIKNYKELTHRLSEVIDANKVDYNKQYDSDKEITLPANVKKKIAKDLNSLDDYFDNLTDAMNKIFKILTDNDVMPLQNDYTPWEGMLMGGDSKAKFPLGYNGRVVKNSMLILTWHKMRDKMEVIRYLS